MQDRVLPARPDLAQYKKQAKELLKACTGASPQAWERVRLNHPRFRVKPSIAHSLSGETLKLADAQLVIAREHRFATWAEFSRQMQAHSAPASDSAAPTDQGGQSVDVWAHDVLLPVDIYPAGHPSAMVLLAHAGGSDRYQPKFRRAVEQLRQANLTVLHTDLLSEDEEIGQVGAIREEITHDVPLLGTRAAAVVDWIVRQRGFDDLPLGYFATGNGAAAAIYAAARPSSPVRAIVSAEGRPDLAGPWVWLVEAPVLFAVGGRDTVKLGFTTMLMKPVPNKPNRSLAVLEGAQDLFGEDAALTKTMTLACNWFRRFLPMQ